MSKLAEKAIMAAFMELLDEKNLDKITVKDIVDRCEISRNTFYYHYSDIPALLSSIIQMETERVLAKDIENQMNWEEAFITGMEFALKNKRAVYHIYISSDRDSLSDYVKVIARDVMSKYVAQETEGVNSSELDRSLVAHFLSAAMVGLILDWIEEGMKVSSEDMIRRLGYLMKDSVRTAMIHSEQKPLE